MRACVRVCVCVCVCVCVLGNEWLYSYIYIIPHIIACCHYYCGLLCMHFGLLNILIGRAVKRKKKCPLLLVHTFLPCHMFG